MNEPIIISIVAPVYGVERFIGRFAESVLSQSYPHIQFVFVDDGTKDSSIDILNELIATGEYDLVGGDWDNFADSVQEKL